jgi:hypothetical protein
VAILRTSAADSPTIPSSGSASRSRSGLRLRSTVPPRVHLSRQLAPPTEPPALLSCPSFGLRRSNRTFRPHLPLESSACTADRASESAVLPGRLTRVSQPAFRPLLRSPRQLAPSVGSPRLLRGCCPACAFSQPFRLTFRTVRKLAPRTALPDLPSCPRHSACAAWSGPFSLAFRSADRLAPSTELRPLPSCLRRFDLRLTAGLPALPSYLTADFPAAFLLRRCPRLPLRLSPLISPLAHPSDLNFRPTDRRLSGSSI